MKTKQIHFKKHTAGKGGWSDWVNPKYMNYYLFKCCDCSLIHEMQFITGLTSVYKKERIFIKLPKEIKVQFRVRRLKIPKELKGVIISDKPKSLLGTSKIVIKKGKPVIK